MFALTFTAVCFSLVGNIYNMTLRVVFFFPFFFFFFPWSFGENFPWWFSRMHGVKANRTSNCAEMRDVTSHFRPSATVVCDYHANVSISLILIGTKWLGSIKVSVIMRCRSPYRHCDCRCQCIFCWSCISFLTLLPLEIEIPAGSKWVATWQQRNAQ